MVSFDYQIFRQKHWILTNSTSVSYLPAQSLKDEDDLQEIIPEDVSKHAISLF